MAVNWLHDVDEALRQAGTQGKPLFLDFSATPM